VTREDMLAILGKKKQGKGLEYREGNSRREQKGGKKI